MKTRFACAILGLGVISSSCADEDTLVLPESEEEVADPCTALPGWLRTQEEFDAYLDCDFPAPDIRVTGSVRDLSRLRDVKDLRGFRLIGTSIRSLDVLENITSLEELFVSGTKIASIELSSLREVEWLAVYGNEALTSVYLPALTSLIEADFTDNPVLTSIRAPVNGTAESSATPYLYFVDNPSLTEIDFSSLERAAVLDVMRCGLTDLRGFTRLETIEGSIGSFDRGLALRLHSNPALASLAGLESLRAVPASIVIIGNDELASLDGLSGLTPFASGSINERTFFTVERNPKLRACEVEQFAMTLGVRCECAENNGDESCFE